MARVIRKRLGELLVERHVVSEQQVEAALDEQHKTGELLGKTLVRLGYATEEDIVLALTLQYGFPYLPLTNYEIDPDVVEVVPSSLARQYRVVPLDRIGNLLTVTMADPLNAAALAELESVTNLKVETFVSTESQVAEALERLYPLEEEEAEVKAAESAG